ncbi:MAG TPA: NAD-dependent epimerase/dehydratase family protein [Gemmatimonadales bacterium]|nr:NAD-dependent epimerase/dehydratase family protein [Gemmatimonadales bacterium]
MSPRALVTGGAGFIGSHLTEELLRCGWRVRVLDDLSTGRRGNLAHLDGSDALTFFTGSASDAPLLEQLVAESDVVFHLAAAVGVKLVVEQPVRTLSTNIRATELVLELAARYSTKVLIASTSEVYGKLDTERFAETDDLVLGPTHKSRWSYAASKIIDEHLALAHARENGLAVTVLRLFNTIGPRQTGLYGMVVPRFVRSALTGEPIEVYGDGRQRRSFTWVGDAVHAMIALAQHPRAAGEVFNIGHTKDISIGELAEMVRQITHSRSEIVAVPFEEAYETGFEDMRRRLPDTTKLRRLIGYRPTLALPAMLDAIAAYQRAELGREARERMVTHLARRPSFTNLHRPPPSSSVLHHPSP